MVTVNPVNCLPAWQHRLSNTLTPGLATVYIVYKFNTLQHVYLYKLVELQNRKCSYARDFFVKRGGTKNALNL